MMHCERHKHGYDLHEGALNRVYLVGLRRITQRKRSFVRNL